MAVTLFDFLSFYNKSGAALQDSLDLTKFANYTLGGLTGLTALAGGGQAGATVLAYGWNEVDTVASNNDSVQLPPAIPNSFVFINNNGASTLAIYAGAGGNGANAGVADQMVAKTTTAKTAATSDITIATGHCTLFVCTTIGVYKQAFDI